MKILGIDFETQSEDPATTNVTEIGAVLLQMTSVAGVEVFDKIATFNRFVYSPEYPPQTDFIVELTGISDDMLKRDGVLPLIAFNELWPLIQEADVILAHNKRFDEGVFKAQLSKLQIVIPDKEWICTFTEVPYADKYRCKQLAHLAFDHGLKMDNRELHRAVNDVDLMLELVTTKYRFSDILAYAREPWVYLKADILPPWQDGGVGKGQATKLGYGWETPRGDDKVFPKTWVKRVKANQVEKEKSLAPFRASVI